MAGSSLLALIDDIASVLDDVAVLSKVAAKKTAGVLGDDLALNAQQVSGVTADRELPVVWAVFKGSALNKLILVPAALAIGYFAPAALAIGYFAPWAVTPLLMIGGLFLCYEGVEKLAHKYMHGPKREGSRAAEIAKVAADPKLDLVTYEKDKIKGAIKTDFILSAEIIAITLGTVSQSPLGTQVMVLVGIAVAMTIGVYGVVAGIVKLDDAGLWLSKRGGVQAALGRGILVAAPWMMKALSVIGTIAMFLVGGGIISHGIPALHHRIEDFAAEHAGLVGALIPTLADFVVGVVAGIVTLAVVGVGQKMFRKSAAAPAH
jgi:predicted DNA repair protein MutK